MRLVNAPPFGKHKWGLTSGESSAKGCGKSSRIGSERWIIHQNRIFGAELKQYIQTLLAKLKADKRHVDDRQEWGRQLDVAARMGMRGDYLVGALMESRTKAVPDASWSVVPLDERWRAVKETERLWKEKASSQVDDKAREDWRARLAEAWK
jgi:hypothetical protein